MGRAGRIGLLLLIAAGATWLVMHRAALTPAALEAWLAPFGLWAPAVFAALYAVASVLFAPALLLTLLAGALFGPVWGTGLALLGATLGAIGGFLVARHLAGEWVRGRLGGRLGRLVAGVEAEGWRFVAVIRLVPIFPFALSNYALGLTRIGLLPYALTTALCMIPGAVVHSLLGYAGRSALVDGNLAAVRWALLALGAMALAAFSSHLVRRLRARGAG
jgi:uncharacterized membrane protein YdjX (TVP38/TMEM64 family)